jgi:hypothetical protein
MTQVKTIHKNTKAAQSIINQAKDIVFYGVNIARSGESGIDREEFKFDVDGHKSYKLTQHENGDGIYYRLTFMTGAYYKFTI